MAFAWSQWSAPRVPPADNPVDYAFLVDGLPRLFVEAKGLGENLDDARWANQTISYATAAGVEWVALTNGSQWRIYNAHAPVPIEDKLFRSVRLHDDPDVAFEVLSLLSRDAIADNRIEALWEAFFVDRQVQGALTALFAGSASELVDLLVPKLRRLNSSDVRASLNRLRATFEFPSADAAEDPWEARRARQASTVSAVVPTSSTSLPRVAPQGPPAPVRSTSRVSPEERRLKLVDVIAGGRIRVGQKLVATYQGCGHTAELLEDGRIRYRDKVYNSPSAAGEAVKIELLGPGVPQSVLATDGLVAWQSTDATTGETVTLRELRRRTALDQAQ
jgi:hypothetical protein